MIKRVVEYKSFIRILKKNNSLKSYNLGEKGLVAKDPRGIFSAKDFKIL